MQGPPLQATVAQFSPDETEIRNVSRDNTATAQDTVSLFDMPCGEITAITLDNSTSAKAYDPIEMYKNALKTAVEPEDIIF